MRKRSLTVLFLSLFCLNMFVSAALAVDTIYTNGTIITMNGQEVAEAVAVTGDRIEAVGSNDAIYALADQNTEIINLGGKVMLPGFYDPHSHFLGYGINVVTSVDLNSPPLGTVTNIADLIAALEAKAQTLTSADQWIQGSNYDDTLLAEMRHPTKADLDLVSGNHPIMIKHISGHIAVANSKALQLAGITAATPDPAGGRIVRDPVTGDPTGVLEEPAAFMIVSNVVPPMSNEDYFRGLAVSSSTYLAAGVTTACEGAYGHWFVDMYKAGLQYGILKNRVVALPSNMPAANILAMFTGLKPGDDLTTNHMITLGPAKNFADGSIQGYTGFLSQPYYVQPAGETNYVAFPTLTQAEVSAWVKTFHDAGWQCHIHGNGDAAIEYILNAYEAAQAANPRPDARHTIIHSQMARMDQLDRMAVLGVIPSFFVSHTYYWGDRHWNIFMGPERAAKMSPCRSALDRGLIITHHNDTPVTPISPLMSVWSAVNRISSGGRVIGADERISVYEALRGVTIDAAYDYFEENLKGSIEGGKLADFVVLGANPLTVDSLDIKDIPVLATIVGNEVVYGADALAEAGESSGSSSGGCFISSIEAN